MEKCFCDKCGLDITGGVDIILVEAPGLDQVHTKLELCHEHYLEVVHYVNELKGGKA